MPLSLTDLDHRAARRSFDRAAGSYDQHAVLQHEVRRRLLERLDCSGIFCLNDGETN